MVRDFSSCYNCNISFRPKEFPIALKIGSTIGKIKNTLSNFQREISSVTNDIDLDKDMTTKETKPTKI